MSFNSLILFWFDKNKRKLPWRTHREPYKIWLSEVILQQTRVIQGTEYYLSFCKTFPKLRNLAEAEEQEVLKIWQGLGYYSRARNLHHTARYIQNELNGRFPDNYKDLLQLKGVGPYTAAAIASICFDEAVPAIDGNAFRVMARYFNIELDINLPKTRKYFFDLGLEIIDSKRPGDYNQAVMELGATICLPTSPQCEICPLSDSCEALAQKKVAQLPVKIKTLKTKNRFLHFLYIKEGTRFLMLQRGVRDVWAKLFTFPMIEVAENELVDTRLKELNLDFQLESEEVHLLTHQRLHLTFWTVSVNSNELKRLALELNSEVFTSEDLVNLPLPKPVERFVDEHLDF